MTIARGWGTLVAGLLGTLGVIALVVAFMIAYNFEDPQPHGLSFWYAAGGVVALLLGARVLRWANTQITPAQGVAGVDHDLRSNDR